MYNGLYFPLSHVVHSDILAAPSEPTYLPAGHHSHFVYHTLDGSAGNSKSGSAAEYSPDADMPGFSVRSIFIRRAGQAHALSRQSERTCYACSALRRSGIRNGLARLTLTALVQTAGARV